MSANKSKSKEDEMQEDTEEEVSSLHERMEEVAFLFVKAMAKLGGSSQSVYRIIPEDGGLPSLESIKSLQCHFNAPRTEQYLRTVLNSLYLLNSMQYEYGQFLWRAYFYRKNNKEWRDSYTKSSYHRIKAKALKLFFRTYDEED